MRILITDNVHNQLIEGLKELGHHVVYLPDLGLEKVVESASNCDGIIINSKIKLTADRIAALPKLQFIARLGSGLEIIDLEAADRAGVAVYSAPKGNCQAVAEHALGMLLSLFNKLCSAHQSVRTGAWDREAHRGLELRGRTVGIIGFGHTGSAFAHLLAAFQCKVLVHDLVAKDVSKFPHCRLASMQEIQEEAEVISLHVSYNAGNYHLIDQQWIEGCNHPIYLINTSRGMVVDLEAVLLALKKGSLAGICLDVLENEKPQSYSRSEARLMKSLASQPQVILSPHVAGWTVESKERIARIILEKIRNGSYPTKST